MYRLILLLLIATSSLHAYSNHRSKEWEIIIFSGGNKYKGVLKKVTDSSVVFSVRANTDEIAFRDIDKIKLRPSHDRTGQRLLGFFVGGIAGGVITGTALSAGREGEPRALAGVVGGIAGAIFFGIAGVFLTPVIIKMISTKKIVVQHTAEFYVSLKQKLLRYCR